ncbi:MAG: PHP domain-containing protein [Gemmatimonadetes bacterium]|nr:PHP domain-containing protein [Gemmatimonadota bacterium]
MFTHLHVHSWFSFGAGVSSPEVLARQAAARGFTALACTDTNGVYGAVEFQQAALAHGLRPIHGAHPVHGGQEVVALATDERGWAALCRAITHIHWTDEHREAGNGKRETGTPGHRGAEPLPRGSSAPASRFPFPGTCSALSPPTAPASCSSPRTSPSWRTWSAAPARWMSTASCGPGSIGTPSSRRPSGSASRAWSPAG